MFKLNKIQFVMFFLVGTVSALDIIKFDNKVTYSPDKKVVLIENRLDLIGSNDIAEITLDTPLTGHIVSPGKDVQVAQFTINGFVDYKDFVSDINFYDMKNAKKKMRSKD